MALTRGTSTPSGAIGAPSSSHSYSHNNDGDFLAVIVLWSDQTTSSAPTVSALTYNSVSLTQKAVTSFNTAGDNYLTTEIWYIDSPAAGSNTVAVTLSESADENWYIVAVSYSGADTIGANTGSATGNSSSQSVTLTTTDSNGLVLAGFPLWTGATITESGETVIYENFSGSRPTVWVGEIAASGGSDTVSVTSSAANRWAFAAAEITEAAATVGGAYPGRNHPRKNLYLRM